MTARSVGRSRRCGQAGFTLVELMVIMLLIGVVGVISLAAFNSGAQTVGRVDDEVRGLGDQRVLAERLSRDLREARGVDTPGAGVDPKSQLTIWIDSNANYVKDTGEVVTWRLSSTPDSSGHYDVVRATNDGKSQVVGRALVSSIAFTYRNPTIRPDPLPGTAVDKATVVIVGTKYDAIIDNYLQTRETNFETRLRNVS